MCTSIVGGTSLETKLWIVTFAHANCRNNWWTPSPTTQWIWRCQGLLRQTPLENKNMHIAYIANAVSRVDLLQCQATPPHLYMRTWCALCFQLFLPPTAGHLENHGNQLIDKLLRLHVHTHWWRHKFGDTVVVRHICPCQLTRQLVKVRPDNTMGLKVPQGFCIRSN